MTRFLLTQPVRKFFTYNEPGDPPVVPPVPPVPPTPPPVGKVFTQDEVNKIMEGHRKSLQTQNSELVTQLEELRKSQGLTAQQRDELDSRIQALSQQHLTDQQKLQLKLDTETKKYKTDIELAANEAKQWKSSYDNILVENAVLAGSQAHKAANPEQMLDLLRGKAKVVPELDATGNATGKFVVKLPVKVIDPKTKATQIIDMDAVEAIGKMREEPSNGNLFMFDGKTGLGGNNLPNPTGTAEGSFDFKNGSPEDFMKFRAKTYGKK